MSDFEESCWVLMLDIFLPVEFPHLDRVGDSSHQRVDFLVTFFSSPHSYLSNTWAMQAWMEGAALEFHFSGVDVTNYVSHIPSYQILGT